MFNKRPDGRRIKNVDPMQLITGILMKKRYDQKIDAVAAMLDAYVAYKANKEAFE